MRGTRIFNAIYVAIAVFGTASSIGRLLQSDSSTAYAAGAIVGGLIGAAVFGGPFLAAYLAAKSPSDAGFARARRLNVVLLILLAILAIGFLVIALEQALFIIPILLIWVVPAALNIRIFRGRFQASQVNHGIESTAP